MKNRPVWEKSWLGTQCSLSLSAAKFPVCDNAHQALQKQGCNCGKGGTFFLRFTYGSSLPRSLNVLLLLDLFAVRYRTAERCCVGEGLAQQENEKDTGAVAHSCLHAGPAMLEVRQAPSVKPMPGEWEQNGPIKPGAQQGGPSAALLLAGAASVSAAVTGLLKTCKHGASASSYYCGAFLRNSIFSVRLQAGFWLCCGNALSNLFCY